MNKRQKKKNLTCFDQNGVPCLLFSDCRSAWGNSICLRFCACHCSEILCHCYRLFFFHMKLNRLTLVLTFVIPYLISALPSNCLVWRIQYFHWKFETGTPIHSYPTLHGQISAPLPASAWFFHTYRSLKSVKVQLKGTCPVVSCG